jgi:hypothetical protein
MKSACLKKNSKFLIFILSLFLYFFSFSSMVIAQEALSLTVKPVRVGDDKSLLLIPGEKKQIQVKVENNSQLDLQIESQVFDFIVDQDGTTPIPVTEEQDGRWSLASWITLAPASNFLQAGGSATVNALIEVPEDALPGGRYAMILHSPDIGQVENQSGAGIAQRAGTLVYVIIDGLINELAYINLFKTPSFLEKGPVPLEIKIRNESDIHITPSPQIKIFNFFGKEIDSFSLDQKNVFPFTERDFSDVWQRKWGFGPYTLRLEATYGLQGQVASAETVVWMIPVTIIIIVLISILIIVAVVLALKKKKETKKMSSIEASETNVQPTDDKYQE